MNENGNEIQKKGIDKLPDQVGSTERELTAEGLLIASPALLGFT